MMRLNSVARPAKLSALMTLGSGLLSGFLLGCPGTLDPALAGGGGGASGMGGAGGSDCADTIFTATCAAANCHSAGLHSAGLNLTPPVPASRLLGVAPDTTSLCNGMSQVFLVAGSTPASGLLISNIQPGTPACGFSMPYLEPALSSTQIACLQQWANGLTAGTSNPDAGQ